MSTIISKNTEEKTVLLNKLQTEEFLYCIDKAMKSFDFIEIFKLVFDFNLRNAPDIGDFLAQAETITKVSDKYETIVKSVTPFQTRCIACSFGKTVNGYEIQSVVKDCENIRFSTKTALYFDITDGELNDFGFCNGFLSREEVNEIDSFI